jgi:hypothetical protein
LLKPVVMAAATPTNAAPANQSVLVTGESVREFLKANEIAANGTSVDAKAALVRVICVRK